MKKTLSLFGLLVVGLMLLANPATGILSDSETETAVAASVATTTVSGDPPAEADDDADDESATTTTAATTTTTESVDASETSETFSVVGSEEDSEFGVFQVEVFFEDGEIVAVAALQLPSDRKSENINSQSVPTYEAAIVAAQSTDIDVISGATVTWENYTASVQSALDEAGFVA